MAFFDTLKTPIFLKEDSNTTKYIELLKELQPKANGELRKKIDKELKIAEIGLFGEDNIAFELKNSNMPMYILRDIHLEIDGLNAQIDYIAVTRKLIFIIECKNLIGDIEIDEQGNFIRHYEINGKKISEGIYSPITQNQRHLDILQKIKSENPKNILSALFFNENIFKNIHKSIVVLANPKTILNAKYAKKEIKDSVIRADQLISYIKNCCEKCNEYSWNDTELKENAERILSFHSPDNNSYAKKYEDFLNELNSYNSNKQSSEDVATDKIEEPVLNTDNDNLTDSLKKYRLSKSREQNLKPYFIFTNDQMTELIEKMPKTKEDLLKISGFGEVKANKYGDDIIAILNSNS